MTTDGDKAGSGPTIPDRSSEAMVAGFRAGVWGNPRKVDPYWKPWEDAWLKGWDAAQKAMEENTRR